MPMMCFAEMEKPLLKSIWNCKRLQIAKTISEKYKVGELLISKLNHKSAVWYWHKDRLTDH